MDLEHWPEWTASMSSVERLDGASLAAGSRVRIKQPKLPAVVWDVTELTEPRYFEWQAKGPGYQTTAGHRIEPEGEGCKATLSVQQKGVLAPVMGLFYNGLTRRYVNTELAGLKARCEGAPAKT